MRAFTPAFKHERYAGLQVRLRRIRVFDILLCGTGLLVLMVVRAVSAKLSLAHARMETNECCADSFGLL